MKFEREMIYSYPKCSTTDIYLFKKKKKKLITGKLECLQRADYTLIKAKCTEFLNIASLQKNNMVANVLQWQQPLWYRYCRLHVSHTSRIASKWEVRYILKMGHQVSCSDRTSTIDFEQQRYCNVGIHVLKLFFLAYSN